MDGVIIVDKPINYTSRDVVNIIGKKYHTKKVGHTGTLDPLATGVLVICINRATKIVELLTSYDKEYIATFKFGVLTDTLDILGNVIKDETCILEKSDIIHAMKQIEGTYMQEVPIYSAVKINGKKLYDYAREGLEVELPKHEVSISNLELLDFKIEDNHTVVTMKCHVSKGTYIRSLGNDIANILGTNAIMTALRRTKQGHFTIENSQKIDDITETTSLISIGECLSMYKKEIASISLEDDILNGKIIDNLYDDENILFMDEDNNPIALYTSYSKDISKLKPWKMFKHRV